MESQKHLSHLTYLVSIANSYNLKQLRGMHTAYSLDIRSALLHFISYRTCSINLTDLTNFLLTYCSCSFQLGQIAGTS